MKVYFALYEMTADNFDLFVPLDAIAKRCGISEETAEKALDCLPVQTGPDGTGYRIEGSHMFVPPLLMMLAVK
ncbi:MAG: hypothetical protein FWE82_05790 [Defluviitaleaceae bacterium]|nr:hypothetical protein [Defluviitaleaceae bacterium]